MISNDDLLNVVILNLDIMKDLSYIKSLKDIVAKTKYNNYVDILEVIENYYLEFKQLPTQEYIKKHLIEVDDDMEILEYFPEYNLELLGRLKREIISQELQKATEAPQTFETFNKVRDSIIYYAPQQEAFITFDDSKGHLQETLIEEDKKINARKTGVVLNTSLDQKTRGCPFGGTTAIGAMPAGGKTATALATAYSAVFNQDLKGAYLSLEIAKRPIYQRMISRYLYDKGFKIDNADIIKSTMTEKQKDIYFSNIPDFEEVCSSHLKIVTEENLPDFNQAGLETFFRQLDNEFEGIDFIVIDQVSLLKYFEPLKGGKVKDEYSVINQYIRYFNTLSYNGFFRKPVAMILLCQIKREAFSKIIRKKTLDLSVFAEASELERSANQAYVLRYVDDLKLSGLIEMTLIKNRDGEASFDYHPAVFLPQYCMLGTPDLDDSPQGIQEIIEQESAMLSPDDLV